MGSSEATRVALPNSRKPIKNAYTSSDILNAVPRQLPREVKKTIKTVTLHEADAEFLIAVFIAFLISGISSFGGDAVVFAFFDNTIVAISPVIAEKSHIMPPRKLEPSTAFPIMHMQNAGEVCEQNGSSRDASFLLIQPL